MVGRKTGLRKEAKSPRAEGSRPRFSIIIPTYNWSSALHLALESVRDQTLRDFEVLVVGDACSDDSEKVVRAFKDPRFSWRNLPGRCGSQWGPNNDALARARGEYVAYLGHDDLWWPTHLQSAQATFDRTGADMVAAATLLYGPPGSGVRGVTGFFPHDRFTPRQFFPPSSMLHRRELSERVGGWRAPEQANLSVDHDFLLRCHQAGASIAATSDFTVFKFNAAWRRDAYRVRDASEQALHLARMRTEGEDFRRRELSDALRAATEDRLWRIENPIGAHIDAAQLAAPMHAFKGSRPRATTTYEPLPGGRMRFPRDGQFAGFEWHPLEMHPKLGGFRWSGPSAQATIILPVRVDRAIEIEMLVLSAVTKETLAGARLSLNGVPLDTRLTPAPEGAVYWSATVEPAQLPAADREEMRLTLAVENTHRPIDVGVSEDRRWIGLAVGLVELRPAGG